jgi:hypothetical protein
MFKEKYCLRIAASAVFLCALHVQSPAQTTNSSFFGIHIKNTTAPLPDTKGMSFGSYRTLGGGVKWADIETQKGVYDFSRLDLWIADAQKSGQDIMFTAYATPHFISSNPSDMNCAYATVNGGGICEAPKDWNTGDQTWIGFITALINHVGPGTIKYYEFWNEINVTSECNMTTEQMLQMDQDLYNTVHALDPKALVTSPSISSLNENAPENTLLPYFEAGGSRYADVVAVHGYGGWPPEQISSGITSLKSVLAMAGMTQLPILITEGSWGEQNPIPKSEDVAFVGRYYLLILSGGIQKFYWYGWDFPNVDFLSYGQLTNAGVAAQQIMNWTLGQQTPVCTSAGTTYTCTIGSSLAMWDTNGSPTVETTKNNYSTLEGTTGRVSGGKIQIGSEPILLF